MSGKVNMDEASPEFLAQWADSCLEFDQKAQMQSLVAKLNDNKKLAKEGQPIKPLTVAEKALLKEMRAKGQPDDGKTWILHKTKAVKAMGTSDVTYDKYIGPKNDYGPPYKPDPERGYCVEDARALLDERQKGKEAPVVAPVAMGSTEGLEPGITSALRRVEQAEIQAFASLQKAQETGDPEKVANASKIHQTSLKTLREYNRDLDADAKSKEGQIPIPTCKVFMAMVGQALNNAEQQTLDVIGEEVTSLEDPHNPRHVRKAASGILYAKMHDSLTQLVNDDKVPEWMRQAFADGVRP